MSDQLPPKFIPVYCAWLKARANHRAADKTLLRAQRAHCKLVDRGVPDERAFFVAGVNLADRRMLKASRVEQQAFRALESYIRAAGDWERLAIVAALGGTP